MSPCLFRKLGGAGFLALLVLALAGCGRNGPLEAPPGATPPSQASAATPGATTPSAEESPATVAANPPSASPDSHSTAPPAAGPAPAAGKAPAVTPVFKSFFLDPLVN